MQTCPKTDCSIETHVHGHGTDEMFLPKSKEEAEGFKPGSLEALLAEAFKAGEMFGMDIQNPNFEEWRRRMLPG